VNDSRKLVAAPVVGVDGGGTGCRARVYDPDGAPLAEAEGGPANIQTGGRAAFDNIVATVDRALEQAGLPPSTATRPRVGLGVAGVTPGSRARFASFDPPFSEYKILSDAHSAALGAHGGADGGIAIMGTGTAACVVRGGAARLIGGWGFRIDDLGSGADIGRRALRAALRAHDGPDAPGAFSKAVLERFEGDVWRAVDWAAEARAPDFATLAPLVFDHARAEEPTAAAILIRATAELERLVRLLRDHGAGRISLFGSIAHALEPHLTTATQALISPRLGDAMDGAALAMRLETAV